MMFILFFYIQSFIYTINQKSIYDMIFAQNKQKSDEIFSFIIFIL